MAKSPILTLLCIFALGGLMLAVRGQPADAPQQFRLAAAPDRHAPGFPSGTLSASNQTVNDDATAAVAPQALIREAVQQLERHTSIAADIRHEIDLFGQRLSGSGAYWEHRMAGDPRTRLELKIRVGDATSSLLQVCDGTHLWTYRKLLDEPTLSQVDVALAADRLRRAATAPGRSHGATLPGLGGLSRILRGLEGAFEFTSPEQGHWGKEKRPVWRLVGRWKRSWLSRLLPGADEKTPVDLSRLPEHLPDHVVVLLGQSDLFPYRIEYRRQSGSDSRPLVTMQWYDVQLNAPVDPNRFIYHPGDLKPVDRTQEFLDSLIERPE